MLIGIAMATAPAVAVLAQTAPAADASDSEDVSTVVVTGSRIVRDGMSAPTPVSVMGAERLEQRAATNIGDMLNELPSFRASSTPASGSTGGYIGGRMLDLRGLGPVRTLVLVDGKRFVPSTTLGTVDTNLIPSILLDRAEVVTGGASAAYGSDAVAGVVNFMLNENLTGLRSSVDYGVSTYGDNDTYTAKLAGGLPLWDGRGHIIAAAEYEKSEGVGTCTARDWCAEQWGNLGRPQGAAGAGMPANSILPGLRPSTLSPTGVINSPGTLRGIAFHPDGTPRRFEYGSPINNQSMQGGENGGTNAYLYGSPLIAPTDRYTVYTRTTFDFTDSLTGKLDLSFGHVEGQSGTRQLLNIGYVIRDDNPFIPTSSDPALDVRGIMAARNIRSFQLGRNFAEFGFPETNSRNNAFRAVASLEGDITGSWSWDAYYQFGRNDFRSVAGPLGINDKVSKAMDAVRNGAGQIVCRVNADTVSSNDDPACIPLNPFGNQVAPGVAEYILGTATQTNVTTEHVLAGNVQGEVFETWAGPVSVASGLEFRSDRMSGDADPISQALGFYTSNASMISGKINVGEAYLETIVPLANDITLAENLELNGAIRRTRYDREGNGNSSEVSTTTWKAGAVWQPVESLRLRATRSRDIRAPNVSELFGPTTRGFSIVSDPGNNGAQSNPATTSGSNPNLLPEVADTMTVGFVVQPALDGALGRMQLSVDYYDIQIDDAIGTLGAQTIANRCFQGATEFCPLLTRDSTGFLIAVSDVRQNVDQMITRGYDVEFTYQHPLDTWGDLDFRLLATYADDLITIDSAGSVDRAGQTGLRAGTPGGLPRYTLDSLLTWTRGPLMLSSHSRYIPSGTYSAEAIAPGDPGYDPSLPNSANTNHVKNAWYFDLTGHYDFSRAVDGSFVLFAAVNNLNNQDPTRTSGSNGTGNNVLFPPTGRNYRLGVRFRF